MWRDQVECHLLLFSLEKLSNEITGKISADGFKRPVGYNSVSEKKT